MDVVMASAQAFVAALNHRAYQLELTKRNAVNAFSGSSASRSVEELEAPSRSPRAKSRLEPGASN